MILTIAQNHALERALLDELPGDTVDRLRRVLSSWAHRAGQLLVSRQALEFWQVLEVYRLFREPLLAGATTILERLAAGVSQLPVLRLGVVDNCRVHLSGTPVSYWLPSGRAETVPDDGHETFLMTVNLTQLLITAWREYSQP